MVTCAFCKEKTVEKESGISYKGKWYHPECIEIVKQREYFAEVVQEIFKLKAPGPKIYNLAKRYYENNGYTYKGMALTLKYIYQVKKIADKKSIEDKTIGLIPFYYDEAAVYWAKQESRKTVITEEIKQAIEAPPITMKAAKRNHKFTYSLEDLND